MARVPDLRRGARGSPTSAKGCSEAADGASVRWRTHAALGAGSAAAIATIAVLLIVAARPGDSRERASLDGSTLSLGAPSSHLPSAPSLGSTSRGEARSPAAWARHSVDGRSTSSVGPTSVVPPAQTTPDAMLRSCFVSEVTAEARASKSRYEIGEPVNVDLMVVNRSTSPCALPGGLDMVVYDSQGSELSSSAVALSWVCDTPDQCRWDPGETLRYGQRWDGKIRGVVPAPPGRYRVWVGATVPDHGRDRYAAETSVEVG